MEIRTQGGSSNKFDAAVKCALSEMYPRGLNPGFDPLRPSFNASGSIRCNQRFTVSMISNRARNRSVRTLARPDSENRGHLMRDPFIDSTPSVSHVKNPITMGIFTSQGLVCTHPSGVGTWKQPSKRINYFSVPPRFHWNSTYTFFKSGSHKEFLARARCIARGGNEERMSQVVQL